MKKYINLAFIYLIAALISGIFYREFVKFNSYQEKTTLAVTHFHLLVLGTFLFLIIALFHLHTNIEEQREFKWFLIIHNISLPFITIMFIVRGILQIVAPNLNSTTSIMISGIAGLSHILMAIGLISLFFALKKVDKR